LCSLIEIEADKKIVLFNRYQKLFVYKNDYLKHVNDYFVDKKEGADLIFL
jgi:uncharacterized C2H2 Zn-finger protein